MTVAEFVGLAKGLDDWEIAVAKHDDGQASCDTTVRVKSMHKGGDWTNGRLVLEPEVELATSAGEIDRHTREELASCHHRIANILSVAAKIARMLELIPDVELRDRIHAALKEIA